MTDEDQSGGIQSRTGSLTPQLAMGDPAQDPPSRGYLWQAHPEGKTIGSIFTATSRMSRRICMSTATISRPSSGSIELAWPATWGSAPRNCGKSNDF